MDYRSNNGTVNFVAGIPVFSTSISLKKNHDTIFGFVFDYSNNDVYYAIKDEGAFCNKKPIHVSDCDKLSDSIISFSLSSKYTKEEAKKAMKLEEKLLFETRGVRTICSSAIELCWLASGKMEGFLKVKSSIGLGSTAGKLIVQEAGGKVTNLLNETSKEIDNMLATNGLIHEKLTRIYSCN